MYHIYVNESLYHSVENVNQVGAIVEQALQANPNAWINVKDLEAGEPLPTVLLPLAAAHPSIEFMTIPQIQALTPEEISALNPQPQ